MPREPEDCLSRQTLRSQTLSEAKIHYRAIGALIIRIWFWGPVYFFLVCTTKIVLVILKAAILYSFPYLLGCSFAEVAACSWPVTDRLCRFPQ